MTKSMKIAGLAAAATLALGPVAAQAGTRASAMPVAADISRASPAATQQNDLHGPGTLVWLLLLLTAIAAAVAAAGGSGRSRG